MPESWFKQYGPVLVDAAKNFFVPIGWLIAVLKLSDQMPPWAVISLLAALGAYLALMLRSRYRAEAASRHRILSYESLVRMMNLPPEAIDNSFTFYRLIRRLKIEPPNARLDAIDLGRNTSELNRNRLTRVFTADAPCEFRDLDFRAALFVNEEMRNISTIPTPFDNDRKFLVALELVDSVIRPNDEVASQCHLRWPSAVPLDEDYWVFPLNSYPNPVGRMEIECFFRAPPKSVHLYRLTDAADEPVALDGPETATLDDGQWIKYSAAVARPKVIHLLKWVR